ncbi:MAG TPA: hypothetical protein VH817_18100 [Thermoleophilaceae bacterium]|jgi:hypothetical protein
MGRANLALILALVASAVLPAASAARKFHYSHRVSISGSLVDHWTINDTRSCGPVGDGTVSVDFHQRRAAKARVEYNRVEGRWEALVPTGGLLGGLPAKPVVGTISLADNTVATPPLPGFDCLDQPIDKSGCGTSSLGGKADIDGVRRGFTADLSSSFRPKHGECGHGNVESWTQFPQAVGGVNGGLVRVKMPSPRSFKRHRTVTVTGTVHKSSSFGGSDPDQPKVTDDVTRTVTITFKRL